MLATVSTTENLQEQIRQAPARLIAGRIKQARKASDYTTLDSLGEAMGGVTRQHLIKLEKGTHRPRAEMLKRIALATGKPLEFFLVEDSGEPNPFPAGAA